MISSAQASVADVEAPSTGASVIAPPGDCRPLPSTGGSPVSIAYERHPAYRELVSGATLKRRVVAFATLSKYVLLAMFKWLVVYEAIPAHLRRPRSAGAVRELSQHVLQRTVWRLRGALRGSAGQEPGSGVVEHLRRNGCGVLRLSQTDIEAISEAAEPALTALRQRRGAKDGGREFMESRTSVQRHDSSPLFRVLDECLNRIGVLDAISAYVGHPARIVDVNPQINDASDDFWRTIFPDRGAPLPRTAYLHRDASGGDTKLMIYLSDVGPRNGPFSFILNSHKIRRPRIREFIAEANDYCFSGTRLESRAHFASLPKFLRRKCAFGNDIDDREHVSQALVAAEWPMTGPRGTVVIFDPKGYHRGGMVQDGERVVITCVVG